MQLVRLVKSSTFDTQTKFGRSIRLLQTEGTCTSIQIKSVLDKRRTSNELNSLNLVRYMKSSTFGAGLNVIRNETQHFTSYYDNKMKTTKIIFYIR